MGLTSSGIVFMGLAWIIIISLISYSFNKVFTGNKKENNSD